jgi:serine/threonine protein kinase
MNHPNIVNLIKVVDDETNNKCYLILEYVNGGELFDYIISYGRLSEKEARKFMRQVIFPFNSSLFLFLMM